MRRGREQIIRDFILLCRNRGATRKYQEMRSLADRTWNQADIAAICKYQISLSFDDFMASGFEPGHRKPPALRSRDVIDRSGNTHISVDNH
jgi:hypothetical protein